MSFNKVFVRKVPKNATEEMLKSAFSEFGEVDEVRIPCDQYTMKPRGFVYVCFHDPSAAEAALKRGSCKVMGTDVEISEVKRMAAPAPPAKRLYIHGIPCDSTEEELLKFFQSLGKVVTYIFPRDRNNGSLRNFCFIAYESKSLTDKLLDDGIMHYKDNIDFTVVPAKSRKELYPDSYKPELAPEKPIIDMSGGEYDPTVLPASTPEYPQSEYPPYPADPYYGYSDGYGYQPPGYWNYPPNDAYGGYAPEGYPSYPPNDPAYPAGTDAAYYDGGKVPANTAYVTPEEKNETPKEPETQPPATTETPAIPAGESKPEETASFPATFPAGDGYSQPPASVASPAVYPPSEPYDPTKPPASNFPPNGDSASIPANGSYNGQPGEFPAYDRGNAGYPAGDYNSQGYYGYYPPYENPPYFPRQPAFANQSSYPREEGYSRGNWDRREDRRETPGRNWDRREDPRGFSRHDERRSRSYERHDNDRGRFDRHGASRPRFDRRELRPEQRGPREGEDSCRIFVSGLDPQVTEQIIRDHFAPYGHVLAVKLPINHETGRQRDLALITMDSSESVDRAISQASHIIMGKRVKEICRAMTPSRNYNRPPPDNRGLPRPYSCVCLQTVY